MSEFSMARLLAGLMFFSFGLHSAREGLQLLAGDTLRGLILRLTDNRFKSFGLGILMTLVLQSSGATTAMLVSFAGTQLLTLPQAFGVILGADVGTTAVVFLLAAKNVVDYALYVLALGFFLHLSSKRRKGRYIGSVLYGFGLVFFGIHLLIQTMTPIRDNPLAVAIFHFLSGEPFWSFVLATAFTAVAHSSTATIGVALSLAFSGVLSLQAALPIVLGANIGTCVTSLRAGLGTNVNAKRVAVAHLFTKVVGVCIAFPFIGLAARFLEELVIPMRIRPLDFPFQGVVGPQIAVAHLLFNVGLAVIFLPLLPLGVWVIRKLVPEQDGPKEIFGPKYLDPKALETPALAFAQAKREIMRLANIALDLFRDAPKLFERGADFPAVVEAVEAQDDKVDLLEKSTRFYLAEIAQESLTEEQGRTEMALLGIGADLEEIGDTVSKELVRLGRKRYETQRVFSDEGWQGILAYHKRVAEMFDLTLAYLTHRTPALAEAIEVHKEAVYQMETDLRQLHLQRLHDGLKESMETSSLHLDVLNTLRRVGSKLAHIAKLVAEE